PRAPLDGRAGARARRPRSGAGLGRRRRAPDRRGARGAGAAGARPDPGGRPVSGDDDRLRRWRLVLGKSAEESLGVPLGGELRERDRVLEALYEGERKGGLGASAPSVARWLGDIRSYFPTSVV